MRRPRPTECTAIRTDCGWSAVSATERGVVCGTWGRSTREAAVEEVMGQGLPEGEFSRRAAEAVAAWAEGGEDLLATFALDLSTATEFRAAVARETQAIPRGQVRTYGEVAAAVGKPGAARGVGQVMATNHLAPFVPCHRVVGSEGLHGFGPGLDVKERLLAMEGADWRAYLKGR